LGGQREGRAEKGLPMSETHKKQWYEELFTGYAEAYDRESFTRGTLGEVDFLEEELSHDRTKKILDIGCGTGRHAIELARRGYQVTGIDLSESQLARAREKALRAGVEVEFLSQDARALRLDHRYDLVMMICEGAFPLMETDEMNFAILENAARSLTEGGKLILTTLNALYPLYHSVKDFLDAGKAEMETCELSFDLMSFREKATARVVDDHGKEKILETNERYYTPSEMAWYLKQLKFRQVDIYGCQLGAFSRSRALTTEDFEMLVVAVK
jgi:2-polyprenyl-3-methyl-5-hydroxy-6-metoxy-1,4-benzoquinol methylase